MSRCPKLDPRYWDCECAEHYIHPKREEKCPRCGTTRQWGPDSRADEVADPKNHALVEVKK